MILMRQLVICSSLLLLHFISCNNKPLSIVSENEMKAVYNEIKTPYKFGLVLVPHDDSKKLDCPFIFRKDSTWYMSYIVFDGRGYETWLTSSSDLLHWGSSCRILAFPGDTSAWDASQRAGYPSLYDPEWGGSYRLNQYRNKYWMTYLGGSKRGYEAGRLSIGITSIPAETELCNEWQCQEKPVLASLETAARWWENLTLYKSTVIRDENRLTGHEFVMYYNAFGDSLSTGHNAERIGMAVSDDMVHWSRFGKDPVLNHFRGITGDPQIARIGKVWVMFYFGAFWKPDRNDGAFDRFACSCDLVNWTDWKGPDLVGPSEEWDSRYAHKPCVVKWEGIVYHFYCAVNEHDQRGIAVAVSKDIGKSKISFLSANPQ
jgi:predicted GH43/DUF377 family glycosyl hydrolase